MKNSFLYKTLASCVFTLKLGWQISRRRIISELLFYGFYYVDRLLVRCVLVRFILDLLARDATFKQMMGYVWAMVALSVAMEIFNCYFGQLIKPITNVEIHSKINQMLYQKSCQVDLSCFEDSEFYNSYMMAVSQAYTKISESLESICSMTAGLAAMVSAFAVIYQIDRMAICFVVFPILGNFVFYGILNSRIFQMKREYVICERIADYVRRTLHLGEYAAEIRMTNVFRLLKKLLDEAVAGIQRVVGRYSVWNIILFWLFQYFTFTLLQEGALVYAGYRVLVSGTMVFAQMAVFQNVMNSNTWILLDFSDAVVKVVGNRLYIDQVRSFLEYEPKIPEDGEGMIPELPIRTIEFSHVWFGYQEGRYAVKDISFRIEAGRSLALAGYNGAGKSTLIKLLLRLYDPDKGVILVNGIDIRQYQVRAYRELFAAAFQDGKIFADTLEENILMGKHGTPEEDARRVWHSLSLAGLAEEVESWPKREQTLITREFSQEGAVLSGGQNQKILAARAFAKESPVAVFDEPSSALDPIAEHQLFQNIRRFGEKKILFFISHRLSSVQDADLVFFMENGRIQERGSHKELMALEGKYADLYRIQAKNYQAGGDAV